MKKFFDSNNEKLSDKAFTQSIAISVISILICLVALCSATYAWFTDETSTNGNTLTSGSFDLHILSVTQVSDNASAASNIEITPDGIGYRCHLTEGTYTVTLQLTAESTAKGHCMVRLGDTVQYTNVILRSQADGADDRFTFTLVVPQAADVYFEPRWGMAAESDIEVSRLSPNDSPQETAP